jgi:phosphoribosylaminoimidazolecarboxamide formyltransferase/IMP cyclohydrolase
MKIAGLSSGDGRLLARVADARPGGADLTVVVSADADAGALTVAADRGIETVTVDAPGGAVDPDALEAVLDGTGVEWLCLDGFGPTIPEAAIPQLPPVVATHPSLLPVFPDDDPVAAALDAGVRVTGGTVYLVGDGDTGPVVTQEPVPAFADDDADALAERIRTAGTAVAYERAIRAAAEDRIAVERDGGVPVSVAVAGDDAGDAGDGAADDDAGTASGFPARQYASGERLDRLRYGENPHQAAAVYAAPTEDPSVVGAPQLNEGAKALSYNNYNDADAALALAREFDDPAAAVIKHTNPAGCATADSLATAYADALSTDPMSAFGAVVALNRECDAATAAAIVDSFKEVVVAPGYTDEALATLRSRENLRVIDVGSFGPRTPGRVERPIVGGRLVQDRDVWTPSVDDLEVVTAASPTDDEVETMLFAWRALRHVKSNGIVLATGTETVGVGMGQVSRVDAVRLAVMKAEEHAEGKGPSGAVLASDAFFPFPDGLERAAEAGVTAVIQPGGSVNDDDVIAAADEHGIAMVHTGHRCFRHD